MNSQAPRAFCLALLTVAACAPQPQTPITVLAAASLGPTLEALAPLLSGDMRVELGPSRLICQQLSGLQRRADVIFAADGDLVDALLVPEHADFNLLFATNRLVLAYMPDSPMASALSATPWQQVLAAGTWRVGIANPHVAPVGQRALQALQDNDQTAPEHLRLGARIAASLRAADYRPDVSRLIAPLQAGELDAAFVYNSEADQHALASIDLASTTPYGLTIPRRAVFPERAAALVQLLLSDAGREAAAAAHFAVLPPALIEVRGVAPAAVWP